MISILSFSQLSNLQLYECLKLRSDVFVCEQNCVYPDLDNKDTHQDSFHVLLYAKEKIIAYARVLPAGLSYENPSIGRVVVSPDFRGKGHAETLMQASIECAIKEYNTCSIDIGAQCYLQKFYEQLGFKAISEAYDEDGIMHVDMRLIKTSNNIA